MYNGMDITTHTSCVLVNQIAKKNTLYNTKYVKIIIIINKKFSLRGRFRLVDNKCCLVSIKTI